MFLLGLIIGFDVAIILTLVEKRLTPKIMARRKRNAWLKSKRNL